MTCGAVLLVAALAIAAVVDGRPSSEEDWSERGAESSVCTVGAGDRDTEEAGLRAKKAELELDVAELKLEVAELRAKNAEKRAKKVLLGARNAELEQQVAELQEKLEKIKNQSNVGMASDPDEGHVQTGSKGTEELGQCCDDFCKQDGPGKVDCDEELDCGTVSHLCPTYDEALRLSRSGEGGGGKGSLFDQEDPCENRAKVGETCTCTCRCICIYGDGDDRLVHWLKLAPEDMPAKA